MTAAELDHAEALFRNPPSASADLDLCLRLVAEVRRLNAEVGFAYTMARQNALSAPVPAESNQAIIVAPNVAKKKAKGDANG